MVHVRVLNLVYIKILNISKLQAEIDRYQSLQVKYACLNELKTQRLIPAELFSIHHELQICTEDIK